VPVPSASTTFAEYRNIHIPNVPTILVQPAPATQTLPLFASASYSVTVSNPSDGGPLTYQWQKNGVSIPGATAATLSFASLAAADSGIYTVLAGNDGGAVISAPVSLTVSNALPVVAGESLTATQNISRTLVGADLIANDNDPEGAALSLLGVNGVCSSLIRASFNSGLPGGAVIYGNATLETSGGAVNSGVLRLNPALGNQAGSIVFNELSPGTPAAGFTASFKLRISEGSAEPADGFSFNFAGDLPDAAATAAAAENGGGSGFSFCVDNYRFAPYPGGGNASTSGMKIRYNNVDIAGVQIPTWNTASYIPVSITLAPNGAVTVMVDGTNVVPNLVIPYVPATGRFGLYARTGGQLQAHYVDDLNISVVNRTPRGGLVSLDSGTGLVTYNPPADACGVDSFVYQVGDGQEGGVSCGVVTVQVTEANPVAPIIVTCAADRTISTTPTSCQAVVPDLTAEVVATDNCSYTLSQSPAAGTLIGVGANVITITARNGSGLTATCQATITVLDNSTAPAMTITRQDPNVVITWPQTCTPYLLEESVDLGSPTGWQTSTATVESVGGNNRVTVPASGNKFYRLKKQP
jgi:hypothetical protein